MIVSRKHVRALGLRAISVSITLRVCAQRTGLHTVNLYAALVWQVLMTIRPLASLA